MIRNDETKNTKYTVSYVKVRSHIRCALRCVAVLVIPIETELFVA